MTHIKQNTHLSGVKFSWTSLNVLNYLYLQHLLKTVNMICMEWRRKTETTHWNHVTNSGAENCSPLPLSRDLFTNTIAMDIVQ